MGHVSPVTSHLSPVTCLALPTFLAMLDKTAFMLKALEARRKYTFGDKASEGLVI